MQKKPEIMILDDIITSPNIEHNNFILEVEPHEKLASNIVAEDMKSI